MHSKKQLGTLSLVGAVMLVPDLLGITAPAVGAFIYDDGLYHVINDDSHSNETVIVQDSAGGDPTTVGVISGGIIGKDPSAPSVQVFGNSVFNLNGGTTTGDIASTNMATVTISAGFAGGDVHIHGQSTLNFTGGSNSGDVRAFQSSTINISGGQQTIVGGSDGIGAIHDTAKISIFGTSFNFALGPLADLSGVLTGTLFDGTSLNNSFVQQVPGQLVLLEGEISIAKSGRNGIMEWDGGLLNSIVAIEWAASLTEPGRTNWHLLTNVVVSTTHMKSDIPVFFRLLGSPETNSLLSGLVAYYPLNGDAQDESGYMHHASIINASLTMDCPGFPNGAYEFDGVDDRIVIPDSPSLNPTEAITISAWVKADDWTGAPRIVSKGTGGRVRQYVIIASAGLLRFGITPVVDPAISATAPLPAVGICFHVVGTYDRSAARIYIDGVLIEEVPGTADIPVGIDVLAFGNKSDSTDPLEHFDGVIDQVRIYDRALTSNEVLRLFSSGE
jgi:hypothetical protein